MPRRNRGRPDSGWGGEAIRALQEHLHWLQDQRRDRRYADRGQAGDRGRRDGRPTPGRPATTEPHR